MARFAVGQAIRSVEPTIVVDAGPPVVVPPLRPPSRPPVIPPGPRRNKRSKPK